jgi:Protein of unknown function (DUF3710)
VSPAAHCGLKEFEVFRRRKRADEDEDTGPVESAAAQPDAPFEEAVDEAAKPARPDGPWDVSEVDRDDPQVMANRLDLGALLVRGVPNMQLQVQVDQATNRVQSVLLVLGDAAVQLLAVAAPRSEAMWSETREQIAQDAQRRGGTAQEADGPLGPELRVVVPVTTPDGKQGKQPSRMVGIDGPRWLLRATFLGRAAVEQEPFEALSKVVRDLIVVRGDNPMPPGDLIPLQLPPQAQPQGGEGQPDQPVKPTLDDLRPGPTITETR